MWHSDGDLDAVSELVAEDFVYTNPGLSATVRGPADYRAFVETFRDAFSNVDMHIEETVVQGDAVVARFTTRATHTGAFMGIDPTNQDIEVAGLLIDHLDGGKISERHVVDNLLGLFEQLGAVESPVE